MRPLVRLGAVAATLILAASGTTACTKKSDDASSGKTLTPAQVKLALVPGGAHPYFQPWIDAGLSQAAAENYLGAIKASLTNPNMVLDLRIPLTKRYEQDVLDTALAQYLAKELDASATESAIADGWNAITDEAGKDKQLAAYVASLGVQR